MAPKENRSKIKAFRRKLVDEPTDDEWTPQLSGSLEVYDVSSDPQAEVPQTRAAATRAVHTQAQANNPSQSKEEGSEEIGSCMPQMT